MGKLYYGTNSYVLPQKSLRNCIFSHPATVSVFYSTHTNHYTFELEVHNQFVHSNYRVTL